MISALVFIVGLLVVAGFVVWAVNAAPFIDASVKPWIRWVVLFVCGLFAVWTVLALLGLADGPPFLHITHAHRVVVVR